MPMKKSTPKRAGNPFAKWIVRAVVLAVLAVFWQVLEGVKVRV